MRSGFLNVTPSSSTALSSTSQDKSSRNKRKFRADPPSASPLSLPIRNGCDRGSNLLNVSEPASNNWTPDCRSLDGVSNVDADVGVDQKDPISHPTTTPSSSHHCACTLHCDRLSSAKYLNPAHVSPPYPVVKASDTPFDNRQFPYTCQGNIAAEGCEGDQHFGELQEADWDSCSERQLEEMLLKVLDSTYKDAIKKIMSFDVSEDEALKAVLRNGRCYGGRDALCSIVDNALACLKNGGLGAEETEPAFTDLQQMEIYVLAEMICILRKVRPFLSKGDTMWCLLMCDMNVAHACAMEDDAISSFSKDASSLCLSSVTSFQSQSNASGSLPSLVTPVISISQHPPPPPHLISQALGSSVNSSNSAPAFSVSSFSSSCKGTIVTHRQANANQSCSSGPIHASTATRPSTKAEIPNEEHHTQMDNLSGSDELKLTLTSKLGVKGIKRLSCNSESAKGECFPIISQSNSSDHVSENPEQRSSLLVASGEAIRSSQTISTATTPPDPEPSIAKFGNSVSEFSSSAVGPTGSDIAGCMVSCEAKSDSMEQCSTCSDENIHTDLHITNLTKLSAPQISIEEARNDQHIPDDTPSYTSTGKELSLSIASVIDSGATEVATESRIIPVMEEAVVSNMSHSTPTNQYFGWTDADGEERKNEMLVQLVHRVKELEAQLQEWTEWAQQKVMQAARRLGKDSAELKALRVEREEYLRLKKEKQALEESTMKKLSEMENALRKASSQVDRADTAVHRLKAENAEVRAEMEAAKLSAAELVATCQEASRREKKYSKKNQGWEKQKAKFQEELSEEKRKLSLLQQELSQAKERHQQAEVRWKQEKRAKEEALLCADSEKRLKDQAEIAAKSREETLRRKGETDFQRHRDDMQRLESQIAQLRMSSDPFHSAALSWGSNFGVPSINMDTCSAQSLKHMNARLLREIAYLRDLSQRDVHRDRECVMCMSEEMSVVFLPCAHQIICVKCNEIHETQGLNDCPSCRAPIQQRICVYGVSS